MHIVQIRMGIVKSLPLMQMEVQVQLYKMVQKELYIPLIQVQEKKLKLLMNMMKKGI